MLQLKSGTIWLLENSRNSYLESVSISKPKLPRLTARLTMSMGWNSCRNTNSKDVTGLARVCMRCATPHELNSSEYVIYACLSKLLSPVIYHQCHYTCCNCSGILSHTFSQSPYIYFYQLFSYHINGDKTGRWKDWWTPQRRKTTLLWLNRHTKKKSTIGTLKDKSRKVSQPETNVLLRRVWEFPVTLQCCRPTIVFTVVLFYHCRHTGQLSAAIKDKCLNLTSFVPNTHTLHHPPSRQTYGGFPLKCYYEETSHFTPVWRKITATTQTMYPPTPKPPTDYGNLSNLRGI